MAALIGQLRDFQLAEDCLQEAAASALVHWTRAGVPRAPAGWLLQVARRKAIDRLRKGQTADKYSADLSYLTELDQQDAVAEATQEIPDERLRLIFTCCHPALDQKSRVALTLRTLGGLTTAEIARGFLDKETTMAQRLVRAKQKIAAAGVPYAVPDPTEWPERLPHVLTIVYLIFNEGYATLSGQDHIRKDLCAEAIYLAEVLNTLAPEEAEIEGLLALLLLIDARRTARAEGDRFVALEHQNRNLWDKRKMTRGEVLTETALKRQRPGPFQIKAAIQALHADAPTFADTDWLEIVALYNVLLRFEDTPVVRLNRAVATSYAVDPKTGLTLLQPLAGALATYSPYFAALADVEARCGHPDAACGAYDRAIALTQNPTEKEFMKQKQSLLEDGQTN
ncbi:MAG: sigma-70 family RNA polymerase sigma factor [Pseudomonadota bacterium]